MFSLMQEWPRLSRPFGEAALLPLPATAMEIGKINIPIERWFLMKKAVF